MAFNDGLRSVLGGFQYVQGQMDQGEEKRRQSGLRALAGDYYGQLDPTAGKVAALGGDAGGMLRDRQGMQETAQKEAGRIAGLIVAAPSQMRPGLYAAHRQKLAQIGLQGLPEAWSDDLLPVAQQMAGSTQNVGIQSTFVDASGNRVGVTRDGRTVVLGQNAPNVQILEGQGGFYGVNKGDLSARPVTMGGPAPQAPPQGTNDQMLAVANQMVKAGIPPQYVEQWMSQQPGIQPVSQPEAPQAAPQAMPMQLQPAAKPQAQRAPTELERRVEMARQMGATPDQIKAMVVGGGQSGNAQASKTNQANRVKAAQLETVQRQIDRLDKAAQSVAGNAVFDGGPLDQYAIKFTPQGQELEQSAAAILPVLTALTRVPGVGAQSDLESRLASLQLPSASMAPEVNKAAIQALREYMADLKAAYDNLGGSQPAKPAAPAGWSIKAIP